MMDNSPIRQDYRLEILAPGEDRRREFKCSAPWEDLKWKVARAALAMANIRDGGLVIVGVQDDGAGCVATGMTEDHLRTFDDDEIKSFINRHADPYVNCSIHRTIVDGKRFLVIEVSEFDDLPVVCKRSANDAKNRAILQNGGIYTRSYQKPESCLVQSQTEMRELVDIAVERGIRRFLSLVDRSNLSVHPNPSDMDRFDEERAEFAAQVSASKRLNHGYYLLSIRPAAYSPNAIQPVTRILEIATRLEVRYYGWKFPFVVRNEETVEQRSAGSPGQAEDWEEFWRMFQSGQFLCAIAYREDGSGAAISDYLGPRELRLAPAGFEPSGVINIHTLIILANQVYEFAARLARELRWETSVDVGITLTNTARRVIISTDRARPVWRFWRATAPHIEHIRKVDLRDLLAKPSDLAAEAATEIIRRFAGSEVDALNVHEIQKSFLAG